MTIQDDAVEEAEATALLGENLLELKERFHPGLSSAEYAAQCFGSVAALHRFKQRLDADFLAEVSNRRNGKTHKEDK